MTTTTESIPAYGFRRPDAAEARAAIERVYGPATEAVWADVLSGAGLRAASLLDSDEELQRIIDAMRRCADPVVGLCAQALSIRFESYRHLASTHEVMVGAA